MRMPHALADHPDQLNDIEMKTMFCLNYNALHIYEKPCTGREERGLRRMHLLTGNSISSRISFVTIRSAKRNAHETISAQPKRRRTISNHELIIGKEIEMSRLKPIYTLAFASILAGALTACADSPARGSQGVADAKITADVKAQLNQMADLGPPGSIRVQTLDRVVYLNGQVDGGLQKRNAESVVRQVSGVQDVADDIVVLHK